MDMTEMRERRSVRPVAAVMAGGALVAVVRLVVPSFVRFRPTAPALAGVNGRLRAAGASEGTAGSAGARPGTTGPDSGSRGGWLRHRPRLSSDWVPMCG